MRWYRGWSTNRGLLIEHTQFSIDADHKCKTLAIEDVIILKLIANRHRDDDGGIHPNYATRIRLGLHGEVDGGVRHRRSVSTH